MYRGDSMPWVVHALRAACLLLAAALSFEALRVVLLRTAFDYDMNFWSEDYLMTSLIQLRAKLPIYSQVESASSNVYAPGTALLHHLALSPFGASESVQSNRVFAQCVQAVACAIGVYFCKTVAQVERAWPSELAARAQYMVLAAMFLILAAYANPLADGLHPTNLESVTLAAAVFTAYRLKDTGKARRAIGLAVVPILALVAKQTTGIAVAIGLGMAALTLPQRWVRRSLWAALPLCSVLLGFVALDRLSAGWFSVWGLEILAAQPWQWHKVARLYGHHALMFLPVLLVVGARAAVAVGQSPHTDRSYLRAALIPATYAPFAVAALLKTGGGPNNLCSLGFALALLATPVLINTGFVGTHRVRACALIVFVVQLFAWRPTRALPAAVDFAQAKRICDYASSHMARGEDVWLARGASCYARAGRVPLDRANAIRELLVANRFEQVGVVGRVADAHYDLILLHQADLIQLGPRFWSVLQANYSLFARSDETAFGDYWITGLQAWGSRRVLFYERKSEAGRHEYDAR